MGRVPAPPPPPRSDDPGVSVGGWGYGPPRPVPPTAEEMRRQRMTLDELWDEYKATVPHELREE